ncbi:MAG: cation:proton antiporter [Deltaproteobacteria bacterium]|jgi:CPA2 family monovalent cation:H+ antiporter-2|nr:cation:proton antiporter [Deltaproteobacteria bacterium]
MSQHLNLIFTLAISLTTALVFGLITQRLRLSPIVGYLLAGVVVGLTGANVSTFDVDREVAQQFAEIGVILLMFGVGLHFHLKDLIAVRLIALPGAILQIVITTIVSMLIAVLFGWSYETGMVFGIAISVASTVVLTRVLADNKNLHTPIGHLAIGWLIVEDLFTILVLVLLPTFFSGESSQTNLAEQQFWTTLSLTTLKLIFLVIFLLVIGKKLLPKILEYVAKTGSRDLFTLCVLTLAIGIAVAAASLFGASMALGAFLAGMVVGQSDFSARAAAEALPMRDAFAVLFFVSVGLLFNPETLVSNWQLILVTLAIILIVKPFAAIVVVLLLKGSLRTALSVGVALAQIGEFSFILAVLGVSLGILPEMANSAIIAAAIISITLNPLLYKGINPTLRWLSKKGIGVAHLNSNDNLIGALDVGHERDTVVLVGFGPVGRSISHILIHKGMNVIVIELNIKSVKEVNALKQGIVAINGDATQREILLHAGIETAKAIIISSPTVEAKAVIEQVRSLNKKIQILINTTYMGDVEKLRAAGADVVYSSEAAVAGLLSNFLFNEFGMSLDQDNM